MTLPDNVKSVAKYKNTLLLLTVSHGRLLEVVLSARWIAFNQKYMRADACSILCLDLIDDVGFTRITYHSLCSPLHIDTKNNVQTLKYFIIFVLNLIQFLLAKFKSCDSMGS